MNAPSKIEAATLASAMAAAFAEIEGATKEAENPAFKQGGKAIKYADLGNVIAAIKPALIHHNLFFTQHPEPSDKGVCIETVLHHAGGESLSLGKLFVPANRNDAQGFGSALTYARRYALVTAFGVPVEDDDGNAASRPARAQGGAVEGNNGDRALSPSGSTDQSQGKQPAHSALKSKIRSFVHDIEGCGDWDTWIALRDSKEGREAIEGCREKLPEWWHGWPEQPDGFIPLSRRIEILEGNLANQIADYARV